MNDLSESAGLPHATIRAGAKDWFLIFSFPGPDRRYSYTHLRYEPKQVEQLIQDYISGFSKFQILAQHAIKGQNTDIRVGSNLTVRVGLWNGVCIAGYRDAVSTPEALEATVQKLRAVQNRGPTLVSLYKQMLG